MSTRIYDAYICNSLTTTELHKFTQFLREQCIHQALENAYKLIAKKAENLIDATILYTKEPKLSALLYTDYKAYLIDQYKQAHTSPRYFLQYRDKESTLTFENMCDNMRRYTHINIKQFATDIIEHKMETGEILNNPAWDMSNQIVVFPISETKMAFMVLGHIVQNFLSNLISPEKALSLEEQEFKDKYQISDYHYQNQTDRPDNITEEEWQERATTWDKILPSGIPMKDGIVIKINNAFDLSRKLFPLASATLIPYTTKPILRVKDLAEQLTMITYMPNDADVHTICETRRKCKKDLETFYKTGTINNTVITYMEIKEKLNPILPVIKPEILTKSLTDFLPKDNKQ